MHGKVTNWACDRCERALQVVDDNAPSGWEVVTTGALRVDEQDASTTWELCTGCANQHRRFMLGRKPDDQPSTDA